MTTARETSAVTHMIAISEVEALELWSGLVIAGDGAAGSEVRAVNVTLTETLRCVTSLATGSP